MGKKLLKVGGGTVLLLIVGIFILSLTLDGFVKSGIQNSGSNALGTEVNVDNVSLSIWNGQGTIDGLMVQNPEGFSNRASISFKEISLEVDLSTLLSDTVVVKNLVVQQPEIFVEQTTNGNNLRTLQNQMGSSSGDSGAFLVIDHLLIKEGSVELRSTIGEERNVTTEIAQLELTGVGRDGSNTVKQTSRQVLEPILQRALAQAAKEGVMDAVKDKIQDLLGG